jgi:holo-[acyl-carrier protein] synthase
MHVLGHGIDLVQVSRVERLLGGEGEEQAERRGTAGRAFLEKVFTQEELAGLEILSGGQTQVDLARCAGWQNPASRRRLVERVAARFAGKEAVMKALGTGLADGISWHDVQILTLATGVPQVLLTGRAQQIASNLGMNCWLISLSHTHEMAMASVIAGRR